MVLNFNIPCVVLLTLLLTSERKDKKSSVHVCGNGVKDLGYEYWNQERKCEERDGLLCTGGGCRLQVFLTFQINSCVASWGTVPIAASQLRPSLICKGGTRLENNGLSHERRACPCKMAAL
jgi:hypothetical protein